jgi:hypothetical protein
VLLQAEVAAVLHKVRVAVVVHHKVQVAVVVFLLVLRLSKPVAAVILKAAVVVVHHKVQAAAVVPHKVQVAAVLLNQQVSMGMATMCVWKADKWVAGLLALAMRRWMLIMTARWTSILMAQMLLNMRKQ